MLNNFTYRVDLYVRFCTLFVWSFAHRKTDRIRRGWNGKMLRHGSTTLPVGNASDGDTEYLRSFTSFSLFSSPPLFRPPSPPHCHQPPLIIRKAPPRARQWWLRLIPMDQKTWNRTYATRPQKNVSIVALHRIKRCSMIIIIIIRMYYQGGLNYGS